MQSFPFDLLTFDLIFLFRKNKKKHLLFQVKAPHDKKALNLRYY